MIDDMLAQPRADAAEWLEFPRYRQLYEGLRAAILDGRLLPGARLPSTRAVAGQLGLARGTVELAYELLKVEGYLITRGAAGTLVNPDLQPSAPPPDAPGAAALQPPPAPAPRIPLQVGLPALDRFPQRLWAKLAAQQTRALGAEALGFPDPQGDPALRRAIADYLGLMRGIPCTPEQIFVTAGYHGALGLIAATLLRPEDAVWFEDPGYFRAREALALTGARLVPVPVDAEGLVVAAGVERAPTARLAVVTPSHQAPLGVTLSLPRRLALLEWAQQAGAWIVEDDYDSEFHYVGRPLPALKGLDRRERVLYTGSFSKVLAPALRVGYLVVPPGQVERFRRTSSLLIPPPPGPEQAILAAFMREGHFVRHLRDMRKLYAARRAALAAALEKRLGNRLRIELQAGGMHLLGWLKDPQADASALARLAEGAGLAPLPLSVWCQEAMPGPALLLSFTNIPETEAEGVVERLAAAWEQGILTSSPGAHRHQYPSAHNTLDF